MRPSPSHTLGLPLPVRVLGGALGGGDGAETAVAAAAEAMAAYSRHFVADAGASQKALQFGGVVSPSQ